MIIIKRYVLPALLILVLAFVGTGVNATPSMIVADQLIVGVPQYAEFKSYLDSLLGSGN